MKNYYKETFYCSEENPKEEETGTDTESTEIQQDADEVVKPGGDIPEEEN